ncbi:MAG: hypothetical protein ABSE86_19565 [Bryobacteraceae bacterium]|jgi:hypothetical protein
MSLMKELLTKKFWWDVKTIFDEAREGTTLNSGDSQAASSEEAKYKGSKATDTAPPPDQPSRD